MRESLADELTRELREHMTRLAQGVEMLRPCLLARPWAPDVFQARLQDLLHQLAEHLSQLEELPVGWRASTEHARYRLALRHLQQQLLNSVAWGQSSQPPADPACEMLLGAAWRALGEGLMLLDLGASAGRALTVRSDPHKRWWQWWKRP